MPVLLLASNNEDYAGTDRYLRLEAGYSDEQLSTSVSTLDREAFDFATGEQSISDPLGDVLDIDGTTASIKIPSADIRSVEVFRNEETQTWDVTIRTGGIIPEHPIEKAQFLFYADRDQDISNNDPDGIKINMDAEFSVEYELKDSRWVTDFRWYNPDPVDFWAINIETNMTYEFASDTLTMHIPYEELPSDFDPNWRVVAAATDAGRAQVDAAPGIGFPPPKGEVYPETTSEFEVQETKGSQTWIFYGLLGSVFFVMTYVIWRLSKKD